MDTTGPENPQQTAIPVAHATLDALKGLVDETICVVPTSSVSSLLPASGLVSDPAIVKAFLKAVKTESKFILRSQAEKDPNFLQPIPCAVIEYGSQVLLLRRNKKGHPLHDTYVVWAGGHVNISDDGPEILLNALRREITEELFITDVFKLDSEPIALIRTQEDARAALHIAVLYRVTLTSNNVALAMDQKEFRETRGSSMSGRLVDLDTITEFYDRMRKWSQFIVGHLWADKVPVRPQGTLFSD